MYHSQYSSQYSFQQPLQSYSVFVNNIPPNIQWRWLKQIFQHHGTVTNVFIPEKRSRSGRKFGFVRFSSQNEAKNAVEKLNGAWFLDYKLNVDFARYNVSSAYWKRAESQQEVPLPDNNFKGAYPRNNSSPPYAEDGHHDSFGEQVGAGESKQNEDLIEVETSTQDIKWLEYAVVASVKSPLEIRELQQSMYREGYSPLSILAMGGSWFLIQFDRLEVMLNLLADGNNWIEKWFNWIRPWSKELISEEKLVWIKIYNLPLHAWNKKVLKQIGDHWGRFIFEDECSSTRQRLDFARILVVINKNMLVKDSIDLMVNGSKFIVNLEVEDNFDYWRIHFSSIQAGCSSSSPVAEAMPARTTLQSEEAMPVADSVLPVAEASVRFLQSNNETPLENEENVIFEKYYQKSYDEQSGIVNREKELGGKFESIYTDEILQGETTVAKEMEMDLILGFPMTEPVTMSEENEALILTKQCSPTPMQPEVNIPQFSEEPQIDGEATADEHQEERVAITGNAKKTKKFISVSSIQPADATPAKKSSASLKCKGKKKKKKANFSRKKEINLLGYYSETPSLIEEEITDEDIRNRNRTLRKEAQATLEVARLLGLSSTANEEDIIRSLMEAEIEEMARKISHE